MKKIIITIFASLFIFNASAHECESKAIFLDSIRIQQGYWTQTETCFISISSRKIFNMEYRNFLVTSRGAVHIFNSFGEGPSSQYTGAKELHIFPRTSRISFEVLSDRVDISLSNGDIFSFDKETAEPINLGRGDFLLDPIISRDNGGGFKITHYDGLILDSGFQMGMSPTWYLNRKSTFYDAVGETCTLKNKELFDKKSDEIFWIHNNDNQLYKYLQKRCPSLTLKY